LLRISVKLPLEVLDVAGIRARARRALGDPKSLSEWGDKFKRVVRHWERSLLRRPGATHHDAEIFGIRIGPAILLGINAEVFSEFTDMVRQRSGVDRCFIIGYANGDIGYLPTRAAYAEGGYEVDVAHFFYGGFRPGKGSLEILAREAANLARKIQKL